MTGASKHRVRALLPGRLAAEGPAAVEGRAAAEGPAAVEGSAAAGGRAAAGGSAAFQPRITPPLIEIY